MSSLSPLKLDSEAAATPRRLFYWFHTTSRQPFETGIQRVTRRLGQALAQGGVDVVPVGRDERTSRVEIIGRGPDAFEASLAASGRRPLLLIPELTADLVAAGIDPVCLGQAYGMRTLAMVHDLIPLKLSSHYSAAAISLFTAYYESFARSDAVLATTQGVADELRRFLTGKALRVPPMHVAPLPAQFGDHPRVMADEPERLAAAPLKLLSIVSWERRKNLPRLVRALAQARSDAPVPIELTLVGRRGARSRVRCRGGRPSRRGGRGVTAAGPLSDDKLAARIASSDATVYPSLEEGFGLPIGESLWLGKPCLCHNASSMAEIAPGGGTLMLDMSDEQAIAATLVSLGFAGRSGWSASRTEARLRPLTSWSDYAAAVAVIVDGLDVAATGAA